jgi:DNA-binding beta-propeller fold protein YncE
MQASRRDVFIVMAGTLLIGLGAVGLTPMLRMARTIHPKTGLPLIVPGRDGDATLLFNGWRITPAGRHIPTGDMLLGGAISPDGATFAIANCGYNAHTLHIVDIATEKEVASLPLGRAWNGIAWSPDGRRIYVAGGVSNPVNDIHVIEKDDTGAWGKAKGFKLTGSDRQKTCVSGLALSADGATLYALNVSDNCLYALDTADGAARARLEVGDHPVTCRLSADGKTLYVADWGGAEVVALDISSPGSPSVAARLKTGEHPNDIALSGDGRMFVSCGNSDEVTVYDTKTQRQMETVKTTLTPRAPSGSTPDAVAVTADSKTLYVANADNNDVCVVDISRPGKSRVRGFIPTGWYTSAVLVSPDGKKVIIGSGKGTGTGPNRVLLPIPKDVQGGFEHHGRQLSGLISFVDTPDDARLAEYTRQVYADTPYKDAQLRGTPDSRRTAIPTRLGAASPIKYVLYIIKENRTYDQVFGDMEKGNGDPRLVLFGREVTPNHHALAEQFVLLDNLYCSGEVSQDGHPWSTSAIATDFTQRAWVLAYSGKGNPTYSDSVDDPGAGYIWEACRRKGMTYRTYGEYAGHKSLAGHSSDRYIGKVKYGEYTPDRDMGRAAIFIEEFREFEKNGTMPRFMIMSLGEDHTSGTRPGAYTPKAAVASNDVALGKIVEAVSHSKYWKEFAIFVIEDDAQNGPDHIDSHRTVGLVISPYTRRTFVDSSLYSTASMLRTMELILGLPPLTQYDASAPPMYASFTDKPDLTPYTALPARLDLNAKNPATAYGARQSAKMDFSVYDRIDEDALNRILWHSIKGANTPYPAPVRRALPAVNGRLHANAVAARDRDD